MVPPVPPGVEEPGPQRHDGLAGGLLQLDLDLLELLVDDLDHPLDLPGCDGPGPGLLLEQVGHVGGELLAASVVLLQLLVIHRPAQVEVKRESYKIRKLEIEIGVDRGLT